MELRKDYILDRYVIFSTEREKRPREFKKIPPVAISDSKDCFFCAGHEKFTPPEIYRVDRDKKWVVRVFPNRFPAVGPYKKVISKEPFFNSVASFGRHEVVVETNDHDKQLWDLDAHEIAAVLEVYKKRVQELSKVRGIEYVDIFKNHGQLGGTSVVHSHTQIIAYNKVPDLVIEEAKAVKKYRKCPYCAIIHEEMKGPRWIYENDGFAVFAPYASRFNYEAWIFPKKHVTNITKLNPDQLLLLADSLKHVLNKLKELDCSYNYFLHISPKKENLHFHIEVCPRIATWAGFELSSNDTINSVSPEEAAEFYRS